MSYNLKIAPSILSANFADFQADIARLEKTDVEYIHIDIMDGHFVPNITFGYELVQALRPLSQKVFDVHLMLSQPERYVKEFASCGSDIISVHVEVEAKTKDLLQSIRALGKKAALVYKPNTSLDGVEEFFPWLSQITLMSVEPGFARQKFMPHVLEKARFLRKKISDSDYSKSIDIEVDGGVTGDNAMAVKEAGVNILVSGSYIFAHKNLAMAIANLRGQ